MSITIDHLKVTVRVRTAPGASLADAEMRPGIKRGDQRVYLLPPPRPEAATGESVVAQQGEENPEQMAWTAEQFDVYELSDRVYEFMRYDARVARERDGSA